MSAPVGNETTDMKDNETELRKYCIDIAVKSYNGDRLFVEARKIYEWIVNNPVNTADTNARQQIKEAINKGYTPPEQKVVAAGSWEWAVEMMAEGKRVCVSSRPDISYFETLGIYYGMIDNGKPSIISEFGDLLTSATDWQLYEPETKGNNFQWALEQMKAGWRVRRKEQLPKWSITIDNGRFLVCSPFTTFSKSDYLITLSDLEATDWEIYNEEKDNV